MRHYVTLFDSKYLGKGLALHASLLRHSSEPFTLHILAMDEECASILSELNLANVRLMPLAAFESAMKMKPVRESRSLVEYFWTCASSVCEYLLVNSPDIEMLTYLDADLFFFSDPKVVFDEIGERSIAIVPHRFAEHDRARLEKNGIFNVGWISFRSNWTGLQCLRKWAAQCRDWCHRLNEGGKFGDQAYLDAWPDLYRGALAIIQNIGIGVAPWNLQQYEVSSVSEPKVDDREVVFYHFHEYESESQLTNWPLRKEDRVVIYGRYIQELRRVDHLILSATFAIQLERTAGENQWQRA